MPTQTLDARAPFAAIESIGRFVLVFAALCYVLGHFVVNVYLRQYGFSDFSLLRTRFILTGAVALIPIAVIAIGIWGVRILVLSDRNLNSWIRSPRLSSFPRHSLAHLLAALLVFFTVLLILFGLGYYAQLDFAMPRIAFFDDSIWGFFFCFFQFVFYTLMMIVERREGPLTNIASATGELARSEKAKLRNRRRVIALTAQASLMVLLILSYLFAFSAYFYPRISEQFGGGKPKIVQLILFDHSTDEGEQAGLPMDGDSRRSIPVPLLWEGENVYLIAYPRFPTPGWSAQINKSMVAAVLTYTEPISGDFFDAPEWRGESARFATPQAHLSTSDAAGYTVSRSVSDPV